MTKTEIALYIGCLVLIVVPIWFIRHKVYDDGLIGRIALAAIAIGAFAILGQAAVTYFDAWRDGVGYARAGYQVAGEEAWLVDGFAVFITWHLVRFHRRVVMCVPPPKDPQGVWPGVRPSPFAAEGKQVADLADRRAARARG